MWVQSNKNEFRVSAIEVLIMRFEFVILLISYDFEVGIIREFNKANIAVFLESVKNYICTLKLIAQHNNYNKFTNLFNFRILITKFLQ